MNGTTTRARPGRGAAATRRPFVHAQRTGGAHTDGANALQIGYAEPDFAPEPAWQPRPEPGNGVPRQRRRASGLAATAAAPLPIPLPRAPFLIMVVSIVVVGVLGVLVLNTKINENAFRLDSLQAQQDTLDLREQQLAQQLAERESPGELRAAATRLGLVPAGTPAFISLPDGRVVGVPQPARAGAAGAGR